MLEVLLNQSYHAELLQQSNEWTKTTSSTLCRCRHNTLFQYYLKLIKEYQDLFCSNLTYIPPSQPEIKSQTSKTFCFIHFFISLYSVPSESSSCHLSHHRETKFLLILILKRRKHGDIMKAKIFVQQNHTNVRRWWQILMFIN